MFFTLYFINLLTWCTAQRQNFLLIIVDDLRTALGCYGDSKAYTPNIDHLAKRSAIFSQVFAQQALCAPSRNSFLTSRRPDTLQLYDFYSYWRTDTGNFTTLPQHLKENGYITKSIGKVFHPGISSNNSDDSPYSWTEVPFHPFTEKYKDAPVCQANVRVSPTQNLICPVKVSSMPNKTLPDIEILNEAKRFILNQTGSTRPFFLAVGFQKPHIPFKYPKKYLKYHPLHKFEVPNPYKWSENVSSIAYNPWNDLRRRNDVEALNLKFPWEKIPKSFAELIIQSYYASVTYIDDLIGQLINQLKFSSLIHNTTIILMSDHGWSLGEHAIWAKYSNYDVALRVPLIMSIPRLTFKQDKENKRVEVTNQASATQSLLNHKQTDGYSNDVSKCYKKNVFNIVSVRNSLKNQIIIDSLVELVDVFPTIANLANCSIPICSDENTKKENMFIEQSNPRVEIVCSEGITLVPLIRAALQKKSLLWKKAAFGQYPRPSIEPSLHPNSDEPRFKEIIAMGYTLKTNKYRYTLWLRFKPEMKVPDWNDSIAEELYDHGDDEGETRNLATSQTHAGIKNELKIMLQRGWRNALPAP
ncbi:iduronate 2-sulfatase isoform X2 [Osmia bicornis bicornis]|uniref:iduronate 2-sulfatase isoform X2 n=1 Tax=Osmia bicornis bicornis TaxID=1437191 RepID=UPI001EAEFA9F|nr:iduronate 2-sulfatase isoform X2 [Osmia bicornis bicornis]